MPGGENTKDKLPRCPKGEVRDKKTKKCVKKKEKTSPKKNVTKKVSPKKATPKKASPNKGLSSKSPKKSPNIPLLSKLDIGQHTKYYKKYIYSLLTKMLNELEYNKDRANNGSDFEYYNLGDLEQFMEEEIDTIKKTNKSAYTDTVFTKDTAKQVLAHIDQYIPYFNKIVDDDFRVDYHKIGKLYK